MTTEAKWLAIVCLFGLCAGLLSRNPLWAYFSLGLILWMIGAFVLFRWRVYHAMRSIRVLRTVQGRDQETSYLWAGRHYHVELKVETGHWFFPSWTFWDLLPEILEVGPTENERNRTANLAAPPAVKSLSTKPHILTRIASFLMPTIAQEKPDNTWSRISLTQRTKSVVSKYSICPRAAGIAILPGVRIRLMDPMKWFRFDRLVPCRQSILVLPSYHAGSELRQLTKHNNAILQHGIHRQRRPGMGFELLELREYADGDPPKTIAWKASARRETLMTRQYESEVPVRIQLFIEGTVGCRIGGFGRRVIDQMNSVALSVSKTATQGGDWIGGYLVSGTQMTRIPSGTGEAGFHRVAKALSEFSCEDFPNRFRWTAAMQEATYRLICDHYPDAFSFNVNPGWYTLFEAIRSKAHRQRVQIACFLAEFYRLADQELMAILHDDDRFAARMQRFLCEHGCAWVPPMIPELDVPKFLSQHALGQIVNAMQQAVLRAKDNEVFVVVVDLLSGSRKFEELLQVIRTAKGRHHRVVVISQSPTFERVSEVDLTGSEVAPLKASEWRNVGERIRLVERLQEVKHRLRELAVPFSMTAEQSAIPVVLQEIELARSGRISVRGGVR